MFLPSTTCGGPAIVLAVKYAANTNIISKSLLIKSVSDIFTRCADRTRNTTEILKNKKNLIKYIETFF